MASSLHFAESRGLSNTGNDVELWLNHSDGVSKLDYIRAKAVPGKCYLNALVFVCDLARLPLSEFQRAVDLVEEELGIDPRGRDLLVKIVEVVGVVIPEARIQTFQSESGYSFDSAVVALYRYLQGSQVRVPVAERDGKLHLGTACWCGCTGPVCVHGWSFQMLSVVVGASDKIVGASGFNMDDFLSGGMDVIEEEEEFEDVYTSLSVSQEEMDKSARTVKKWQAREVTSGMVDPEEIREKSLEFVRRMDKRNGTNLSTDLERRQLAGPDTGKMRNNKATGGPPPPPAPPLPKVLRVSSQSKARNERSQMPELGSEQLRLLKEQNDLLLAQLHSMRSANSSGMVSPPQSPEPKLTQVVRDYEPSLRPEDSSSVLERYGRQFTEPGTVFTVQKARNAADSRDEKTVLVTEGFLVEGYQRSESIARREAKSVRRLQPINGLPRPFNNTRLNFLANFDTALYRARRMYGPASCESMLKVMRSKPLLPVDNLLCQLLNVTIDRRTSCFVANPFRLPYIEIGMVVTEESLVKMLTLTQEEYKQLWFEEMKSINVPGFHGDYKGFGQDPVDMSGKRVSRQRESSTLSGERKKSKSRSLLGF